MFSSYITGQWMMVISPLFPRSRFSICLWCPFLNPPFSWWNLHVVSHDSLFMSYKPSLPLHLNLSFHVWHIQSSYFESDHQPLLWWLPPAPGAHAGLEASALHAAAADGSAGRSRWTRLRWGDRGRWWEEFPRKNMEKWWFHVGNIQE